MGLAAICRTWSAGAASDCPVIAGKLTAANWSAMPKEFREENRPAPIVAPAQVRKFRRDDTRFMALLLCHEFRKPRAPRRDWNVPVRRDKGYCVCRLVRNTRW